MQTERRLTAEEVERYVKEEGMCCPFSDCRKRTLTCECVQDSQKGIETDVRCRSCGRQFTEQYELTSIVIMQEKVDEASTKNKKTSTGSR